MDEPPAYDNANQDGPHQPPAYANADQDDSNETLQPVILILAGHFIHAESADSPPLYELSRGVSSLSHSDESVTFTRLDHNVRTNAGGTPRVARRDRHIFDLLHPAAFLTKVSDSPYPYHLKAVSRRAIGNVGLKKVSFSRHGVKFKAMHMRGPSGDDKLMFEVKLKNDKYEWIDFNGRSVAVEDEADSQYRLVVTTALQRETMDALVALWCVRLWHESAIRQEKIPPGEQGKYNPS